MQILITSTWYILTSLGTDVRDTRCYHRTTAASETRSVEFWYSVSHVNVGEFGLTCQSEFPENERKKYHPSVRLIQFHKNSNPYEVLARLLRLLLLFQLPRQSVRFGFLCTDCFSLPEPNHETQIEHVIPRLDARKPGQPTWTSNNHFDFSSSWNREEGVIDGKGLQFFRSIACYS